MTQSENKIFTENGYTTGPTNLNNLPEFVALSTTAQWGQFTRGYLKWNTTPDCRLQVQIIFFINSWKVL